MNANGWFQIGLYLFVIFLVTKPLGVFMTRVFNREKTFLDPILGPIEKLVYRMTGVDEKRQMRWTEYAVAMLLFSGVSLVLVSEGVVQNLKPYTTVDLIQPYTAQVTGPDGKTTTQTVTQQVIAQGPVASQEAIKEFGTNGGGFFNANSAHPFENPTPL